MDDIFNTDATIEINLLETLVGEGRKYATQEDLAKAYLNADAFIANLKRENEEQRVELQTRLSVEEQLKQHQRTPVEPKVETPPVKVEQATDQDLAKRVKEVLNQDREEQRTATNINEVAQRLVEVFGDEQKAKQVVQQKAEELGVSVQFLQEVASRSPKAFYTQLGLEVTPVSTPQTPRSEVQSTININGGIKAGSYEFYEALRKSNPKSYFTPKIQNQLMKDAMEGRYVPR